MEELTFRTAEERDCGLILSFIKALAAYEKMLDSMFSEEAMDVSADISVMETMLAREGFSGDGAGFDQIKE